MNTYDKVSVEFKKRVPLAKKLISNFSHFGGSENGTWGARDHFQYKLARKTSKITSETKIGPQKVIFGHNDPGWLTMDDIYG